MRTIEPLHTPKEVTPQLQDRSNLSSLYPQIKPKDESTSQRILAERLKKNYALFKIPLYLALALLAVAGSLKLTPLLVLGDPFSGVFIAIGLGLVALLITFWEVRLVVTSLYNNSLAGRAFFGAYILAFAFPASITFFSTLALPLERWALFMAAVLLIHCISVVALLIALHAPKHQFAVFLSSSILVLIFVIVSVNSAAILI